MSPEIFMEEFLPAEEQQEVFTRALVVDDSDLDRVIMQKVLIKHDLDVFIACDGQMAIEVFKKAEPDIVFMDLHLSDTTGYEITKKIKELNIKKYVPIVFVTGASDYESLEKCIEVGGDDYIVKPIDPRHLKAKISSLLRIKQMHDAILNQKMTLQSYIDIQDKEMRDADHIINNMHIEKYQDSGNLDWVFIPQHIMSGDVLCSAISPNGNQMLMLGDNTGHGLPAAIGSMTSCEVFYGMANKGFEIEKIAMEINKKLCQLLPIDRFLSACLIDIDPDYESITIWNAGMPDVIITDANGEVKQYVPSIHMPLGISPIKETHISPVKIGIEQLDRIYCFSDGATEVFNQQGKIFGDQRLYDSICAHGKMEKGRAQAIVNDVLDFKGDKFLTDDLMLIEIDCNPSNIKKVKKKIQDDAKVTPLHWQFNIDFKEDVLRKVNPVPVLIQTLSEIQGLYLHREKLFLILSEMYSNALEHGLLGLDSKLKQEKDGFLKYYELRESRLEALDDANIIIELNNKLEGEAGVLTISIEHSGEGFDYSSVVSSLQGNGDKSGRGVALLNKLCRRLEYSEQGRKLTVEYEWRKSGLKKTA